MVTLRYYTSEVEGRMYYMVTLRYYTSEVEGRM